MFCLSARNPQASTHFNAWQSLATESLESPPLPPPSMAAQSRFGGQPRSSAAVPTEEDTGFTVSMRCIKEGLQLVSRLLETLESNPASLPRVSQDLAQRHTTVVKFLTASASFGLCLRGRSSVSCAPVISTRFARRGAIREQLETALKSSSLKQPIPAYVLTRLRGP